MDSQFAPIETLNMSGQDKAAILQAVNPLRQAPGEMQSEPRAGVRALTHGEAAVLGLPHDSMSLKRFSVLAHNLSRQGVGIIHGRFVYPDTPCEVELKTLAGDLQPRRGQVVYCKHVKGLIHEMGIHFEAPLDIRDFVRLAPEEELLFLKEMAEHMPVAEQDSAARVMIVDDFASDRRLFSHWLNKGGINTATLNEYDEASALAALEEQHISAFLIDYHLGTESGADLIRVIRESGYTDPIVAMSADDDTQAPEKALAAGACEFIRKPFTKEQLLDTFNKLLDTTSDPDFQPIFSALKGDEEMQPLLADFARGLPGQVSKLSAANTQHDFETIERLVYSLKSVGAGYGFEVISEHASGVMQALNADMADMDQITQQVNQLVDTLSRVRVA